ncbi:MAG: CDP-diacylglycerol--serine O-phosphatidyltransferase [Beijerinckiaceae bacterium]|nr:CDP-diacylglycerol--serine O-phosphatidyltransferase [Beijerinckiaceae bacterium]
MSEPIEPQIKQSPRRKRFARIPMRYVLPNLVTLLGLALGLTSIRFSIEGRYELAVIAIAAAGVLDGLDGRLARALDGQSRFGAELDSLADFIDFGVAPAMLLYLWSLQEIKNAGWFACMVYVIACALRLARFNVMIDDPNKPKWMGRFFTGMPSPAGAIVVLLPIYLHLSVLQIPQNTATVPIIIAYVLLVAFLMVSRIPHFSGKEMGRVPREYFLAVMLAVVALILLLASYPAEVLVLLTLLYLGLIPLAWRRFQAYQAADDRAAAAVERPSPGQT